jgi:chitodextrinase
MPRARASAAIPGTSWNSKVSDPGDSMTISRVRSVASASTSAGGRAPSWKATSTPNRRSMSDRNRRVGL